ncbi:MAG: response regulator [Chthonomonas sp.]|nr:response regulator [Chthonomonas sp.]
MSTLRVLIADDDPIILLDLRQTLQALDYEIVGEATDGQQAVQMATQLQPDVCVFDVKMPIMDGIEAASLLSEQGVAPVVLLTAYSDRDLIQRAADAAVFGYLVKPFKPNDLPPAIEVARSRFEQNAELSKSVSNLEEKLEVRKLLDKAKGLLMQQQGISESEAYRRIQTQSMSNRKSMREVAEAILLASEV